jgi:hypothetical protein
MAATVEHDTTQHLTIHFEDGADGWVTATIEEEPAAISQGRSQEEAYANVLDALHDLRHEPTPLERFARAVEDRVERLAELLRERRTARQ